MNHQIPTAEEFLDTRRWPGDDDDYEEAMQAWKASPGVLHVIPPDPMTRVAEALEAIVDHVTADKQPGEAFTAELSTTDDGWTSPEDTGVLEGLLRGAGEELDDTEAKLQTLTQVISDVDAALGKSKAAPALAAKAVIDAWRNPKPYLGAADNATTSPEAAEADLPSLADMDELNEQQPERVIEGHTRTEYDEQPGTFYCRDCTLEQQAWVQWPCPTVTLAFNPLGAPVDAEPDDAMKPKGEHQQPAHDAPVEVWRAYARALGYAGPEIDKANRSVIRTTLGIAHQNESGA